jgi:hypothetical protein
MATAKQKLRGSRKSSKSRRPRRRPGAGGKGQYFRIEVRPSTRFLTYRLQDIGRKGHTKRLAGRRAGGTWATKSWLILKSDAHVSNGRLVIDHPRARAALRGIRGPIRHLKGDIFLARPRRDIPESEKPTPAQRRARAANIRKAMRARRRSR